jgi:hypothetical protein
MPVDKIKSISKSGDPALYRDVTLSEGANITLTQVGQDISIAAGGGALNLSYDSANHEVDISGGGTSATIPLAAADGATEGLASFTAADFNSDVNGNISIDYVNAQLATAGQNGFLSSADWTIFNNKGSGDILNGGNTGLITIGTNTAAPLSFETNNVIRATVTGGASTGGAWTMSQVTANTVTVTDLLTLQTGSTGTPGVGYGTGILFQGESSTTNNRDMARISALWETATDASRTSQLKIQLYNTSAASLADVAVFTAGVGLEIYSASGGVSNASYRYDRIRTSGTFIIGDSSSTLTLGGSNGAVNVGNSTGTVSIINTAGGFGGLNIYNSSNIGTATGNIQIGAALTFTQTSATRNYFHFNYGFAPTSGTAVHNQLYFDGTFNQTGGASGITRAVYLNHTLTAVADFRGIEIGYSSATAKGIYQTGILTTNNFAGPTNIGSLNAPVALTPLTVEYATANTATVQDMIVLRTNSTGVAANGFGGGILFQGESSTTDNRDMARISSYWATATDASREGNIGFELGDNGGALTEVMMLTRTGTPSTGSLRIGTLAVGVTISGAGITPLQGFIIGNNSNTITIGNSSGQVAIGGGSGTIFMSTTSGATNAIDIASAGASQYNIRLLSNVNAATSTAGIQIGGLTYTQTSGTRNLVDNTSSFSPTSGTAIHNQFIFSGTFNQTGGANGITRNIYLNPTLTAVADFRGIESTYNTANAWHIYQTGASSKGNAFLQSSFGSTSTPGATVDITGSLKVDTITNDTGLAAGTWTPTRSAEVNMDGTVTTFQSQYLRVGNTVTVSGRFTADPTLGGAASFEMDLPVASNFGAIEDCAGIAFSGAIAGQGAQISASIANNTMVVTFIAVDITSQDWSFTATYQVI